MIWVLVLFTLGMTTHPMTVSGISSEQECHRLAEEIIPRASYRCLAYKGAAIAELENENQQIRLLTTQMMSLTTSTTLERCAQVADKKDLGRASEADIVAKDIAATIRALKKQGIINK